MAFVPNQDEPQPDLITALRTRAGRVALVGRDAELRILRAEIDAVFGGKPRTVLLAGEAGIGKSRLLAEAMSFASAKGATVLLGRCVDERGMPPYLPWIDALGAEPRLRDIRRRLTASKTESGEKFATLQSPAQRKLALFDAVARSLDNLAQAKPFVLAFDDLHWSDAASNELLRHILIHATSSPMLILGAYRSEEAATNEELCRTVDELARRRLLTSVPIGPLSVAETGRLVASLLGQQTPALTTAIHAHCDGNPFIIEEVLRALGDEGRLDDIGALQSLPLPRSVAAIIERRVNRVSERCRSVLETAALAGRTISIDLIATALEIDPEALVETLDEAAGAALVRPLGTESAQTGQIGAQSDYIFLHDRVREAIAARISTVQQRRLHARLGDALETLGGREDDLSRLAALTHHFRLARHADRAAAYAERLGHAAMRAHAHAEAARAFRLAVESDPATHSDIARGDRLLCLGDAALLAGHADAIDTYRAAEQTFATVDNDRGAARALRRLGTAHARREELDLAVAYLDAATTALRDAERDVTAEAATELRTELAEVLIELCTVQGTSLARYDEAISSGRRALAITTESPDGAPALEANARLALAKALLRIGNLAEGHALLPPALALALRAGQPDLAAEVSGALANYHYWTGDLAASERAARRRQEFAVQAGDPYALRHAVPWLANLALARGDWDEMKRLLTEAEPQVDRIESPEPHAFLRQLAGLAQFHQGRYTESVALLEEATAGFRQSGPATLVWYLGCLAQACLAAGDADTTARVAGETIQLVSTLPPNALPSKPAVAQLGIIAARTNDTTAAERWYDALRPAAGQHHWVLIDRVLGMLATTLGREADAEGHFATAVDAATRGGIRPELALTLAERGLALRRSADPVSRAAANPVLQDALNRLRALSMAGEARRVMALLAAPAPSAMPAGLTQREVEVLALVAQGLTNRDIGARLSISEKTVTNHLTHIFTKANLDNRAAAAAFALRHGLA